MKNVQDANKMFEEIEIKDVQEVKKFINIDKETYQEEVVGIMLKNGKNEKVPFNNDVIEKAVKTRMNIAQKEAGLYITIYDRTRRILIELNDENIKIAKSEKVLRDVTVKLAFLNAVKEYIVGFLDNERMTVVNGKKTHQKLMEEAIKNFDNDMLQIQNLYELIIKETTGKSTKKAYKELYNKNYLKDIKQKERYFEEEVTNIKINMGTVINSNYWRIEGIKNIYNVFQEEVSEKFNKDLSEYKIEEIEEIEENQEFISQEDNTSRTNMKENYKYKKAYNDKEYEDEEYDDEEYDDEYEEYEDEEYEDEEYEDEEYEDEEYEDEEYDDEDDDDDEYDDDEYDDEDDDDDEYDDEDDDDDEYDDDEDDDDEYNDKDNKKNKDKEYKYDKYEDYDYENEEYQYYEYIKDEINKDTHNKENDEEITEDKIDKIIKNSRKKANKQNEENKAKGLFGKLFKK